MEGESEGQSYLQIMNIEINLQKKKKSKTGFSVVVMVVGGGFSPLGGIHLHVHKQEAFALATGFLKLRAMEQLRARIT